MKLFDTRNITLRQNINIIPARIIVYKRQNLKEFIVYIR